MCTHYTVYSITVSIPLQSRKCVKMVLKGWKNYDLFRFPKRVFYMRIIRERSLS